MNIAIESHDPGHTRLPDVRQVTVQLERNTRLRIEEAPGSNEILVLVDHADGAPSECLYSFISPEPDPA